MKRIVLFLLTNVMVMLMLSVVTHLLGLNSWLEPAGINHSMLLAFCAIFGFGGAFISLLLSKTVAKWSTGARVIDGTEGSVERWLVAEVSDLAAKAGIKMPEVAVYDSQEVNAFATGASKDSALVAVSSGLICALRPEEVRAVLAHEVAHASSSDMTTMALLQGVVNTFVMFIARVVGTAVDKVLLKNEEGQGWGYFLSVIVLELVFGLLASMVVMRFSRHREYRADWRAAELLGSAKPMQDALNSLAQASSGSVAMLPKSLAAFGIRSRSSSWFSLLSSHPEISDRVSALNKFGH